MRAYAVPFFAVVVCGAWSSALASPTKLYLNFSDGSEELIKGSEDDASRNVSRLCSARPYLPWLGAEGCGDREACKTKIADLVQDQWRDFGVEVTVQRPTDPDYSMVIIGPPSGACQFGLRGIAHIDCGNRVRRNVALAFDCGGTVSLCATVISHELGHGFGLGHSRDPMDIMYGGVTEEGTAKFRDASTLLSEPACGATSQNSHARLFEQLGAWPAEKKRSRDWFADASRKKSDRSGCQLGRSQPIPWLAVGLVSWLACITRRLRRRARRHSARGACAAPLS